MSKVTFTKKHFDKLPELATALRKSSHAEVSARSEESVAGEADLRDDEPMEDFKDTVKQQERIVAKLEAIWIEKKEEAKEAKDEMDRATSLLRSLIREELPLLDQDSR